MPTKSVPRGSSPTHGFRAPSVLSSTMLQALWLSLGNIAPAGACPPRRRWPRLQPRQDATGERPAQRGCLEQDRAAGPGATCAGPQRCLCVHGAVFTDGGPRIGANGVKVPTYLYKSLMTRPPSGPGPTGREPRGTDGGPADKLCGAGQRTGVEFLPEVSPQH